MTTFILVYKAKNLSSTPAGGGTNLGGDVEEVCEEEWR
jgi:hypothetical protein